jgi:hypothetical protein
MHIGIIGTGRMAKALARGWLRAGHTITFGSRSPDSHRSLATEFPHTKVVRQATAIRRADVVVIAIPYAAVKDFAIANSKFLQGKLVIDISNPFDLLPDNRIAGAEITAAAIGEGARVMAAFKDNFWTTFDNPVDPSGLPRDVHYAGDDEEGKAVVNNLVVDLGFRPVDCGPLKNARALDAMVPLLIELDKRYAGGSMQSSWKFLST